jgi:serpin B
MKKTFLFLMVLAVFAGCNTLDIPANLQEGEVIHSGCATATKSVIDDDNPPLLTLKYKDGGLLVTCSNTYMNCSIKESGIACHVSVEGDAIHCNFYEKDGPTANCICLVESMSTIIKGLETGKEYSFYYGSYEPIKFTFRVGFIQIIDPETLEISDDYILKTLDLPVKSNVFIREGNNFALNFLNRVNTDPAVKGNFIISPLSLQILLGMLLNGAQGQTADEICQVLGYGKGEAEDVNEYCQAMMQQLPQLDSKTQLALANALAVNQEYSLLDSYKKTVGQYYDADVFNLDFFDKEGTTKIINKWCSDHTNGLIDDISPEVIPEMLAIIMNALYFKGIWSNPFSRENTGEETFTMESGDTFKVPMMKKHEEGILYQENETFSAVRLFYGKGAFAMTLILPAEGKTVSDVTAALNGESWREFLMHLESCNADLWLPKFETKFRINLNDILSDMGMPSSFNALTADFKAMSDYALCLSLVQQDAIIKVDEEGTEAAAVSHAGMATSVGPGANVVFHADRPFLYLITETGRGTILFAGRYSGK